MKFMKLLIFVFIGLVFTAEATEPSLDVSADSEISVSEDDFFLFDEPEEIACSDLGEAFNEYSADNNLHNASLIASLRSTLELFQQWENEREIPMKELQANMEALNNMISLSEVNQFSMIEQTDNLAYFLQECQNQ